MRSGQEAFKIFRVRSNGTLGSLFINRRQVIPIGVWLKAESHRTNGYQFRPGWHCAPCQFAPHLTLKGRIWMRVEVDDFVEIKRPESQGGFWWLAKWMKVVAPC